jgi:hypothetical protein
MSRASLWIGTIKRRLDRELKGIYEFVKIFLTFSAFRFHIYLLGDANKFDGNKGNVIISPKLSESVMIRAEDVMES